MDGQLVLVEPILKVAVKQDTDFMKELKEVNFLLTACFQYSVIIVCSMASSSDKECLFICSGVTKEMTGTANLASKLHNLFQH